MRIINLMHGIEESNKIYAKVSWPVSNKRPSYAFEIDYFRINIIAEQVD